MRFIARHAGVEIPVEVERHGSGYRVRLGDKWIVADLVNAGPYVRSLRLEDGTQLSLTHHRDGNAHEIALADSTVHVEITDPMSLKRRGREDEFAQGGVVKALMHGRIVRVMVSKGELVRRGTALMVLEAMKMENEVQAPSDGVIEEVFVEPGQTVEGEAELVRIGLGSGL